MDGYSGNTDQRYGHITYAHCGEDLMICNLFELLKIERPSYLDIGAHHPFHLSNTALLYGRGSRGINVEANPVLMPEFQKYRPEDINVNIGISPRGGDLEYFMWDQTSGRNTFSPEWADKLEVKGGSKILPTITIAECVAKHFNGTYPDLMSIDIEGLDYDVLAEADFSHSKPKIVCVESWDTLKFKNMMTLKGYRIYSRHSVNLIFIDETLYEKALAL